MNWWRTLVAFLVAPLAVPLLFFTVGMSLMIASGDDMHGPYIVSAAADPFVVAGAIGVMSYVFSFLLGVPTYLFLRARRLTAFRFAPVAGAFVGFVAYWMIVVGIGVLGSFLATWYSALYALMQALFVALIGAVVGTILWLIARPDRDVASTSSPSK